VFLRKDGTFSETRETKMSSECFVMRLFVPNARKSGDGVKRTRKEWAIYRQEQRELEALSWWDYEEAYQSGELAEAMERDDELFDEDWNLREPYATRMAELEREGVS
jgi:hypothetical protein